MSQDTKSNGEGLEASLPDNYNVRRGADQEALDKFPIETMTPAEYVARRGHGLMVFDWHLRYYEDPYIKAWLVRVYAILDNPAAMERCLRQYLTPEEYARVTAQLEFVRTYPHLY